MAIGDFNLFVDRSHQETFMQAYDLSSLIKKANFKKSCIDLNTGIHKHKHMQPHTQTQLETHA